MQRMRAVFSIHVNVLCYVVVVLIRHIELSER